VKTNPDDSLGSVGQAWFSPWTANAERFSKVRIFALHSSRMPLPYVRYMADIDELWGAESEAHNLLARQAFPILFSRLTQIDERRAQLSVSRGSRMDGDNEATRPVALGNQVEHLLAVSSDHLGMMRTYIEELHIAPPFAMFSLVRASIEASCIGLWLLLHAKRKERIERTLQLFWFNRLDVSQLHNLRGQPDKVEIEELRIRLTEIVSRHKSLQNFEIGAKPLTTTTDMILDAQRRLKNAPPMPALDAWKACSGITHSNLSAALSLLGVRYVGNDNEWGARHEVKAPLLSLATIFDTGVFYAEALLDAHEESSRSH